MPVILDQHMREKITHEPNVLPLAYFENELSELPGREGPLHWHTDFEIARAQTGTLDYQVGKTHLLLEPGDSLFINQNLLHGVRQVAGEEPDPMPNIVFSGTLIAPETSVIYQKYVRPVADCPSLPFAVFRQKDEGCAGIRELISQIFTCMQQRGVCYEMAVQRSLSSLFEYLFCHLDTLSQPQTDRIQLPTQIRVQKMLAYIYDHYAEPVTSADIAASASISRSEAARCFHEYMGCSPVTALIRYRLQTAYRLLHDTSMTIREISLACGFHSTGYFSRQFRQIYGYTPGRIRNLGK